jgi:Fe-Mn family superoxide dismutase
MQALIQALPFDPTQLPGLSERLLRSHHANNYGGAVKRLNAIRASLESLPFATTPGFTLNGLKREELLACNSMLLHEVHFASMGGGGADMVPAMDLALCASFGTAARWREEFVAMGRALAGGSGWVVLAYLAREGRLVNQWAADHTHALAGGVPLLALDMYEHAYHMDFGSDAGAWVDAFMANLNWDAVYHHYQHAVESASESIGIEQGELTDDMTIVDVRRAGPFAQASHMLPRAQWRDPAQVANWGDAIDAAQPTVVYCVYGHEVCRATALRLRAQGRNVRFLRGGIDGWQKAGLPVTPKEVQA